MAQAAGHTYGGEVFALAALADALGPSGVAAGYDYLYVAMAAALLVSVVLAASTYRLNQRLHAMVADLEESRERLGQVALLSRTVVWDTDTAGLLTHVSPSVEEVLGYRAEELEGRRYFYDLHPEEGREEFRRLVLGKLADHRTVRNLLNPIETKDGRVLTVSTMAFPLLDANGLVLGYRGADMDVTERLSTEAALRARETKLRYAMEATNDGIWDVNLVTGVMELSPRVFEMMGYAPGEFHVTSETWPDYLHPDDREEALAAIRKGLAGEAKLGVAECRLAMKEGGWLWVLSRGKLIEMTEDGAPLRIVGTLVDITARKEAEEAACAGERRAHQQRSALAQLTVSGAITAGDVDTAKRMLSEVAARTLDVERVSLWQLSEDGTELVCFELFELSKGEHSAGMVLRSEDYLRYFECLLRVGRIVADDAQQDPRTSCFTQEYLKPLGIASMLDAGFHIEGRLAGVVCLEHTGTPRTWQADEESFAMTLAAITAQLLASAERRRAEDRLRARDELLARLTENVPGFLFQFQLGADGHTSVPYASQGIRSVFEVEPGDVRDDAELLFARIHLDDVASVRASMETSARDLNEWNEQFRVELPVRGVRWVRGHARPERHENGSTVWHGHAADVTEQVETIEERRRLELQFERTQRLDSLGMMAGGIAHDFNNILMAVLANAEEARQELPSDSGALKPLGEIHEAAERAAELCRQMLAYAGKSPMTSECFRVEGLVKELVQLLRVSIPKKVRLVLEEGGEAPAVAGDSSQIGQVAMNLIINGAEATGNSGGTVTVRVEGRELHLGDSMRMGFDEVLPPGAYCELTVSDDGVGMDSRARARIFEPFYTTKFTGRGLGLAAVLGIVRAHKGALAVKSKSGKGTEFRVLLPAAPDGMTVAPVPPEPEGAPFRWEGGVLLVDDEMPLRIVGQRMLERMGCRVWTAEDGLVALERYQEHAAEIDLVLLDLTMPNMDGVETLSQLRKLDPNLPVIIASGFSPEDLEVRFAGQSLSGTLQKPYGFRKLEAAIRAFVARLPVS